MVARMRPNVDRTTEEGRDEKELKTLPTTFLRTDAKECFPC